jgi:hypothetical protein
MQAFLPPDFKEFLKLLDAHKVEYLLIGGYAVGYYGYPRPTGDMDVWIAANDDNARKIVAALAEFGFDSSVEIFRDQDCIARMGVRPFQIEILASIDGVEFDECYAARNVVRIDDVQVNLINLEHLKINKRASGRLKDLSDLENLP